MRLTKHFVRNEFACHCGCGFDTVDVMLLRVLSALRRNFGLPVYIVSGARCVEHNHNVHGAKTSQHLYGKAADVIIKGVPSTEVADWLEEKYPGKYGLGRYPGWTHIDVRTASARWGRIEHG